jgi:hypothetical protein
VLFDHKLTKLNSDGFVTSQVSSQIVIPAKAGIQFPYNSGYIISMKQRLRLNEMEFDRVVKRAIRRIPSEIRRHLKNVLISVQKRPSKEVREEDGP